MDPSCGMRDLLFLVAACRLLVVACGLLVVACMWDLVPQPGIKPGPPALGVWSLTREVPGEILFELLAVVTSIEIRSGDFHFFIFTELYIHV